MASGSHLKLTSCLFDVSALFSVHFLPLWTRCSKLILQFSVLSVESAIFHGSPDSFWGTVIFRNQDLGTSSVGVHIVIGVVIAPGHLREHRGVVCAYINTRTDVHAFICSSVSESIDNHEFLPNIAVESHKAHSSFSISVFINTLF